MGVKNLTHKNGRLCILRFSFYFVDYVIEVKGKPWNFEACLCGSLYSIFTTSFYPYAFLTNGYKRFSKTKSTDPRQRVPLMLSCKLSVCFTWVRSRSSWVFSRQAWPIETPCFIQHGIFSSFCLQITDYFRTRYQWKQFRREMFMIWDKNTTTSLQNRISFSTTCMRCCIRC